MALCSIAANAVPALPGYHNLRQPDGTIVRAKIVGDENFHYYETEVGELLMSDAKGYIRPLSIAADGTLQAVGTVTGKASSLAVRQKLNATFAEKMEKTSLQRIAPNPIKKKFPTTGEVTGLILLVNYTDVKLTPEATQQHYDELCNKENLQSDLTYGSVLDYFKAQSNGQFTPKFDVFGPIELPHERAYYGLEDGGFNAQFRDACLEADKMGLDFSKYDINDDGFIDFVFIIYAGHGEAQGGPVESVWPAMQDFSNYIFDWFDGLQLGVGACSCELKGASGTNLDGVGTICHEFSHILGLADIYDTRYGDGYGMAHYDLMDVGSYNDNQKTPSGYTAMDKYTLGWIEPQLLEESQKDVRLEPFDISHQSIFLVNPENANEYFTLENRQQQGWDKGIPGHGLVISYVHYVKKLWDRNNLNSPMSVDYEHCTIVPADHSWEATPSNEAGDPFPGTLSVTEFTPDSQGSWWFSQQKAPVFAITNIREQADGSILFDYTADVNTDGIHGISPDATGAQRTVYDYMGRRVYGDNLPAGIYIIKEGDKTSKVVVR